MQKQQSMSSPVDNHNTSLVHHNENTTQDTKMMAKLLDAVMVKVKKAYPATKYDGDLRNCVEEQLNKLLPTLQTPDHPPYAFMIEHALVELNEEGGSSEEEISKFIKATYKDLPWGHCSLLKHHLKKLKEAGAIVSVSGNRYVLPSNCNSPGMLEQKQNPKNRRRQMGERNRKHKFYKRDEFTKSQYVAVHNPEPVNVKKEVVIKQERTPLPFKAIEGKDHSKQNGPGIKCGQGKGSDTGDGGKVIHVDRGKIKNQKGREEVEISLIRGGNQENCHQVESFKEGQEENLPAIREGNQKDQLVKIVEKSISRELNVDSNGQKEPEESGSAYLEQASVFGHCGGVSQETLEQCQQINNPVTESLKERQEVNLPAIGKGNQEDQSIKIAEKSISGELNVASNGKKEPKESRFACQEEVSVFGHSGGVSQEIPAAESEMEEEQQGITVEKQTQESRDRDKSADDSNPLGKDLGFIKNKNQAQKEQQPVIFQKHQSLDGQQVQMVEQTECYRRHEMVGQSKPSKEQENQVTCEIDQDLVRPMDIVITEENLADGKRRTDLMEEESKAEKREDGSLVEHHSASQQEVEIFRERNEGGKQWDDAIGPDLQNKQMVIEEIENDNNSLVQHIGSMGQEVQEQEHQFKAIYADTIPSGKLEDHLLERQGGHDVISSSLKPLFASPDLGRVGSVHPGKEQCLEFLKKTIQLQAEFNQKTIRLQEEYNKKILSLQEELFMQLTLGESSGRTTNHAILDSRQNDGLRDSAGLYQQPEVRIQVEAPGLRMIGSSGHADVPMHQPPVEPQQLPASSSKRPPEIDLSVPENLLQRGEKRRRVLEHQDLAVQELNSHGFSNAMKTWLVQFEKKIFDALGRSSEPKLDRSEKPQLREHDARSNALPGLLISTIQPSSCQVGKGHSVDPVQRTLEPSRVLLEEQGQQLHKKTPCQGQRSQHNIETIRGQPGRAWGMAMHPQQQQQLDMQVSRKEVGKGRSVDPGQRTLEPSHVLLEEQGQQLHEKTPCQGQRSQHNIETIRGQPGRAWGMAMHPQQQQQLDMQVSGKELRSRVITSTFPSYRNRNYTLPVLGNSFTNNFGNAPYGPPSKSDVNGNIVLSLPNYQTRRQQLQQSSSRGRGRGRGRGHGRGRGSALQTSGSMTTFEQAILSPQSTPKRRGRPPKTNHDSSDVVAASQI